MRENPYDQADFFQKYGTMDRSRQGLAGAAEWPVLRRALPPLAGRRVLDLGCGYGWHCRYARRQGAAQVLGVDCSRRMLARAAALTSDPGIRYQQAFMEDLDFPADSFDVALSSLAFHYVADFEALARRVCRWLAPGGDWVFSVEHPVFTAQGPQTWRYTPQGEIDCFPVDRYFQEGPREAVFLGERVVKYHRTLTSYAAAILDNGLSLRFMAEPQPPAELLDRPGMRDELRRPMMLILAGHKPGPGDGPHG